MNTSLIITTYNWPEALELSLLSVLNQTTLPGEVIVADDGSTDDTGKLVEKIASFAPIPIIHSWQEDKGFRPATSRNKAIAKARSDYIILIDGDMVLERKFIMDHVDCAKLGYFIQGSRVIISEARTNEMLDSGDITLFFFSRGVENRKNCIRSQILSKIFSKEFNFMEGIKACNSSFWRKDALAINGFNEDFVGWGREDSDFACRLMNSGVNRFSLKFRATSYHLHHDMCSRKELGRNNEMLQRAVTQKLTRCGNGIDKYLVAA